MNFEALKSIRNNNLKWSITKCKQFSETFIDIITKKYPIGIDDSTYFVIPGYEHVTKNQPIIAFNPSEGSWELETTTKFIKN